MESTAMVWIFCGLSFLIGGIIGAVALNYFSIPYKKIKALKDQLATLEEEFESYKAQVSDHFDKTVELTNKLTKNYREVFEHVSAGAKCFDLPTKQLLPLSHSISLKENKSIAGPVKQLEDNTESNKSDIKVNAEVNSQNIGMEKQKQVGNSSVSKTDSTSSKQKNDNIIVMPQPKDYAPKKNPKEAGMLSEDFSVKSSNSLTKDPIKKNSEIGNSNDYVVKMERKYSKIMPKVETKTNTNNIQSKKQNLSGSSGNKVKSDSKDKETTASN